MYYKDFKNIKLSGLGLGNMRLPVTDRNDSTSIDMEKAQEIVDYAMANGINYFDSAYVYHGGESETFLGKAMAKYPRESYHIATKFLIGANPDYKEVFETQLKRLKTDYIDFYLLHAVNGHSYKEYLESGCIEYFLEQQKAGRIRYFGFSAHAKPEDLEVVASHHAWDFAQIQLNYYDWKYSTAKEEYEVLTRKNIPVVVMEPVRGGRLAELCEESVEILNKVCPNKTPASWAFRWLMGLPNVHVILSGMSNMEQIADNVETFRDLSPLNEEEQKALDDALEAFHKYLVVPCTACRYCCDDCPMGINIPDVMEIYNRSRTNGRWALRRIYDMEEGRQPMDCIGCGACSAHCPQNIDIPEIMQTIVEKIPER